MSSKNGFLLPEFGGLPIPDVHHVPPPPPTLLDLVADLDGLCRDLQGIALQVSGVDALRPHSVATKRHEARVWYGFGVPRYQPFPCLVSSTVPQMLLASWAQQREVMVETHPLLDGAVWRYAFRFLAETQGRTLTDKGQARLGNLQRHARSVISTACRQLIVLHGRWTSRQQRLLDMPL